jgi:C2 domain
MGDCGSRPKPNEEEAHDSHEDHSNDPKFVFKPSMSLLDEYKPKPIKTADEQMQAQVQLKALDDQILFLESSLSKFTSENPPDSSKLLIEIQKGKNLTPNISCLKHALPYVTVELSPGKITYTSSPGKLHIPSWYQFYCHTAGIGNLEKLIVSVKFKTSYGDDVFFGTTDISFSKFADQNIVEDWYLLKCIDPVEGKPAIKLRIQAIYSEKHLYLQNIQKLQEIIPNARKLKKQIETEIEHCYKELGPEGLGS